MQSSPWNISAKVNVDYTRQLIIIKRHLGKTGMRNPLFKAPDGSRFEILWEKEDLT